MLSDQQIKQLLTENESLRVQLQETNEILAIREEELAIFKQNSTDFAALLSKYNGQLNDLDSMQNHIGRKQQEAEGAAGRERALQEELADAYGMKEQYDALFGDYAALQSNWDAAKARIRQLEERNTYLEQMAKKAIALQSEVDIATIEKETLQLKIEQLQILISTGDLNNIA